MNSAILESLCKAWLSGDKSAGPPLYDAMEEAGWPWVWVNDDRIYSLVYPRPPRGESYESFGWALRNKGQRPPWFWRRLQPKQAERDDTGYAETLQSAKASLVESAKKALRGC